MNSREVAGALGVSVRRARQLLAAPSAPAVKARGRWEADRIPVRAERRPLSDRSRQVLASAIRHRSLTGLHGQDKGRAAARIRALRVSSGPASLIADWWGHTAPDRIGFTEGLVAAALAGDNAALREALPRTPRREHIDDTTRLAGVIAYERAAQGLSVTELAADADVDPTTVRAAERGAPTPLAATRRILARLQIEATALPGPR